MRLPSIRARGWRLAILGLMILGLAPGTWIRTPIDPTAPPDPSIVPLPVTTGEHAGFTVQNLWQITGTGERIGGYSAMGLLWGGQVRLFSDKNWLLSFPRPDEGPVARSEI